FNTHTLSSGNTVEYGCTNQTLTSESYSNLTLSGSGTKTMPSGAMTVASNLSMSGSAAATTGASGTFTVSGNVALSGTASLTAGNIVATTGTFTIGSGTTFSAGSYSHTIGG